MPEDLQLSEINNLPQLLERTPTGTAVYQLIERLGLVTPTSHTPRRPFKSKISDLTTTQLSDEYGYWNGEYGRIVDIIGVLNGQEKELVNEGKRIRAQERGRIRRTAEQADPPVKKTATQINDEAEESSAVRDHEEEFRVVLLLQASLSANKEAVSTYITAYSREMSYRSSQMDARIYAG